MQNYGTTFKGTQSYCSIYRKFYTLEIVMCIAEIKCQNEHVLYKLKCPLKVCYERKQSQLYHFVHLFAILIQSYDKCCLNLSSTALYHELYLCLICTSFDHCRYFTPLGF